MIGIEIIVVSIVVSLFVFVFWVAFAAITEMLAAFIGKFDFIIGMLTKLPDAIVYQQISSDGKYNFHLNRISFPRCQESKNT